MIRHPGMLVLGNVRDFTDRPFLRADDKGIPFLVNDTDLFGLPVVHVSPSFRNRSGPYCYFTHPAHFFSC
ncbi:hypothetical protein D3C87_2040260 [compost metagenome]